MSRALPLLACLLFARTAAADEAPPESYFRCSGKKAGDACDVDGGPGACIAKKCSKLDYSQGTPPQSVEYDCMDCVKGAPVTPPPSATAGATPTAAPAAKSGCRVDGGDAGLAALALLALAGLRRRVSRTGTRR